MKRRIKLTGATVVAPNDPILAHLGCVWSKMKQLGPPSVKAIYDKDSHTWFAAEGSHRLALASKRGIAPTLVDISGCGATIDCEGETHHLSRRELREWLTTDDQAPRYLFPKVRILANDD